MNLWSNTNPYWLSKRRCCDHQTHTPLKLAEYLFNDIPLKVSFSSTFEGSLGIWGLGQLALAHMLWETHGLGTLDWFAEEGRTPPLRKVVIKYTFQVSHPHPYFR